MTEITLLSYNLRKHKASHELVELVHENDVSILCLQECDSNKLPEVIGSLHLADATVTSRLGLALYYDKETFELIRAEGFSLERSLHDRILHPADERLLAARLRLKDGTELVAASFHAAPLSASNVLRRKQIRASHALLQSFGEGASSVMAGDYNYPVFQKKLVKSVEQNGYELTLSDAHTYSRWLRGHYDFVTSSLVRIDTVKTLPRGASDHKPIVAKFAM